MSYSTTRTLQGLLKAALIIGILAAVVLALLLAWWVSLLFAGAWLLYSALRRLLRGGPKEPAERPAASVIEGEYRVEMTSQLESGAESARSDEGRGKG